MVILLLTVLGIAFLATLVATLAVLHVVPLLDRGGARFAGSNGQPGGISRLGGLGIVAPFLLCVAALWALRHSSAWSGQDSKSLIAIAAGGSVMAALGLYDDFRGSGAATKLGVQCLAATIAVTLGFRIVVVESPFLGEVHLGAFSAPVTVLWIVGLTNALNLIDGLDGLAAGIAVIALVPVAVIGFLESHLTLALAACGLCGSLLGFLTFNFHPARIFMGDTGSLFLGFVLSLMTVESSQRDGSLIVMMPILALGLPILDTSCSVARRIWLGRPVFSGDRSHIHHRLIHLGLSHRATVMILYAIAALLATGAAVVYLGTDLAVACVLVVCLSLTVALIHQVGYLDLARLRRTAGERSRDRNRRENRELERRIAELSRRLRQTKDPAQALGGWMEFAYLLRAKHGRLELIGPNGDRETTWTWEAEPATASLEGQIEIPLLSQGRRVGSFAMVYPEESLDGDWVEHVFRILGRELDMPLERLLDARSRSWH